MIKHVLLFKFKPEVSEEEKVIAINMLRELKGKVPEIIDWEVGKQWKELPGEKWYDFVQVSSFENEDAIERYGNHPEHQKVRNYLKSRTDWVKVDYEV